LLEFGEIRKNGDKNRILEVLKVNWVVFYFVV